MRAAAIVASVVLASCGGRTASVHDGGVRDAPEETVTAPTSEAGADTSSGGDAAADVAACLSPLTSCGAVCVDLSSNVDNCGACGAGCTAGHICSNGACWTDCGGPAVTLCPSDAGGTCADLSVDDANCGSCGHACPANTACANATCVPICGPGLRLCGMVCVDPLSDPQNCGGCGVSCQPGTPCANGQCVAVCSPRRSAGEVVCNGACIDPMTNSEFCGASGNCQGANAGTSCGPGQVCLQGRCEVVLPPDASTQD